MTIVFSDDLDVTGYNSLIVEFTVSNWESITDYGWSYFGGQVGVSDDPGSDDGDWEGVAFWGSEDEDDNPIDGGYDVLEKNNNSILYYWKDAKITDSDDKVVVGASLKEINEIQIQVLIGGDGNHSWAPLANSLDLVGIKKIYLDNLSNTTGWK